jgi:signal transduction histidine kinase
MQAAPDSGIMIKIIRLAQGCHFDTTAFLKPLSMRMTDLYQMISFKTIIGFLFAVLVATITSLSIFCFWNNEETVQTSVQLTRAHQLIQKTEQLGAALRETQLKLVRVLGEPDTLQMPAYIVARGMLIAYVTGLKDVARDENEISRVSLLALSVRHFTCMADSLIDHRSRQKPSLSLNAIEVWVEEPAKHLRNIHDSELLVIKQLTLANTRSIAAFNQTFMTLVAGIALLLAATFLVVRYNFNKRLRVQTELERVHVLFEKVFYESPIAMVISEFETGMIINCNQVYATMVNYEPSEIIGKTAADLGIFVNREMRQQLVSNAAQKGMLRHKELYIRPRGMEPIYISVHAHVITLHDRQCLLTAVLDLSSRKKAEDETRKALEAQIELNRLKSNFVTLASHEFRTPLTTILSSTFLLENYIYGNHQEKTIKHLSRIKSSVNNLTSILDEFLSVTRIEEGNVLPNYERINLSEYMKNVCNNLLPFAKAGQTIIYDHSGANEVTTDPVLLANIIGNLVTNSIKYSPENSQIHVTSAVNAKIHLSVKDNGMGIPDADQKNLFQRFYRASNAGTVQGTGLGLHIMKHYVEMLHGTVHLESEVGKGTQVDITLESPE